MFFNRAAHWHAFKFYGTGFGTLAQPDPAILLAGRELRSLCLCKWPARMWIPTYDAKGVNDADTCVAVDGTTTPIDSFMLQLLNLEAVQRRSAASSSRFGRWTGIIQATGVRE